MNAGLYLSEAAPVGAACIVLTEISQYVAWMIGRFHLEVGLGDSAIAANEIADPGWMFLPGVAGRAVSDTHFSIDVAKQIVRKVEFVSERFIFRRRIATHAEHHGVFGIEVLDSVTEPFAFDGSAGCVGFGVPPKKDVLTCKVGQRNGISVLVLDRKRRCFGLFAQSRHRISSDYLIAPPM